MANKRKWEHLQPQPIDKNTWWYSGLRHVDVVIEQFDGNGKQMETRVVKIPTRRLLNLIRSEREQKRLWIKEP
jgi:hypothetical protein